jgi:hypothetical protein
VLPVLVVAWRELLEPADLPEVGVQRGGVGEADGPVGPTVSPVAPANT